MKYFVTGATGFIGGRLTRALIAQGHQVVAVVRTPAKAQDLAALGVELVKGDITEKDSMRAGMRGVDGVFHVAAWYKVGEKSDMAYEINVTGTRNVLELMQELNIPKGVYTSTLAVFGDTKGKFPKEDYYFDPTKEDFVSVYDETKWRAHYEVAVPMMQAGLPLVIVQPGLVYGQGDTSSVEENMRLYLQKKLPMLPQKAAFMWAHVDDIVTGHLLAMSKGRIGESYIIAGEHSTFMDAMKLAEEITGIPAPRLTASPALLKTFSKVMGVVNSIIPLEGQYHPETLRAIAGVTYLGDNSKARHELDYNPRPLREGLRETLEHLMHAMGMTVPV